MIAVATGKDLKGTGVWGFINVKGTTTGRATIAAVIVAIVALTQSPGLVSALTTDSSINSF